MAKFEVTGLTKKELAERRETYEARRERRGETDERPPFDERFCLWKIPRQPEDYEGPPRYCTKIAYKELESGRPICDIHYKPNFQTPRPENLDNPRTASMTHGMTAELKSLRQDLSEKDRALYDWIVERYSDAYDLDLSADPAVAVDLHRLAMEIVRAERGRGHLIEEGEVHEKKIRDDEGHFVVDENGKVVTEKSEHYLAQMMHRQDKKITDLHRELLVSRRERSKHDTADEAVEGIKSFAEIGAQILDRDDKEYDPDDWD